MIEVTATDLRKDLFRILDRMVETGEVLRVRRKGGSVLSVTARWVDDDAVAQHQRKVEAGLVRGVREDWADYDAGDITDGRHIEWKPEDN
ncbi:hypothetical protein [Brevundimonas aurifodinae]|uniref:Antitoxin n=2 Tax=Brevundimonas TaxID=41275 RepID=A0ABV1NPI6_9CAUL|nr:MAG: hypothetical protein B7Z42_00175 [Brevundimonas sp. 12-68-7]OYX35977.1 MAG: hypothetical protein B7Z01_01325 [Brevundimonas subvibrioides]